MTSATAVTTALTSRSTCPICASAGEITSERWGLRACIHCGHVWADRLVTEDSNDMFETDEYATWRVSSATQRQRQREIAEDRIAWVRPHLVRNGRALEIGCSTGEVVEALASRGWTARGVDLAEPAIKAGRERNPALAIGVGATAAQAGFASTGYDLAMAFHVIEHITELDPFAAMLYDSLRPGGVVYLRMPNWRSWSRRMFKDRWPSNVPEHVHHFTPQSIELLLTTHGFEQVESSTLGLSRDWIGGARRTFSSEWSTDAACAPVGERALGLLRKADKLGRPLFAIEESFNRGSELIAIGRRPR